jgi:hypothetical protein
MKILMLRPPVFSILSKSTLAAATLTIVSAIPTLSNALPLPSQPGETSKSLNSQAQTETRSTLEHLNITTQPLLIADRDDDDDDKKRRDDHRGWKDRDDVRAYRIDLNRAKNLARQAAEAANGGIRVYRAEDSMHGPANQAPCVDNGDSWTFTFLGRRLYSRTMTIESVVTVYKYTQQVVVNYNGAIRNVRNDRVKNWKGLLKVARLARQNALVLKLDVLDKPFTDSASAFYEVCVRRNNQWVTVYRTTATQLITNTAGRVSLSPVVIPLSALQLGDVDWSRLELKTIAYVTYGSQQVLLQDVAQSYQSITQITSTSQVW